MREMKIALHRGYTVVCNQRLKPCPVGFKGAVTSFQIFDDSRVGSSFSKCFNFNDATVSVTTWDLGTSKSAVEYRVLSLRKVFPSTKGPTAQYLLILTMMSYCLALTQHCSRNVIHPREVGVDEVG